VTASARWLFPQDPIEVISFWLSGTNWLDCVCLPTGACWQVWCCTSTGAKQYRCCITAICSCLHVCKVCYQLMRNNSTPGSTD